MKRDLNIQLTLSTIETYARLLHVGEHIVRDGVIWQVQDAMFRDDGAVGVRAARYSADGKKAVKTLLFVYERSEKVTVITTNISGRF